jgi:hypothetical protein
MFIVIYKEGTQLEAPLTKQTYELAQELPGDKYIFEFGLNNTYVHAMNVPHGLWFNTAGSNTPFIHGDYQLTNLVNHTPKRQVDFVFRYKNIEDIAIGWNINQGGISKGLTLAIREIMLASKFSSWADYQKHRATRDEIDQLKEEVEKLKKENEELRQQLPVSQQN